MKFKTKYKICLWKEYFNTGYGVLNYPKWIAAIFGVGEIVNKNYLTVFVGASLFFIFCILFGKWWYSKGWILAEREVGNQFNFFQREVRDKLKEIRLTEKLK